MADSKPGRAGSGGARSGKGRRPFSWRRLNTVLHRDLGYLAVGLTLVYAISGLAVNHAHQWNASYSTTLEQLRVSTPLDGPPSDAARRLLDELDLDGDWVAFHQDRGSTLYVGFKDRILTLKAGIESGEVSIERKQPRWLLRELNQLHLNEPRGLWTWIADAYAVLLALLAVSGMLILRGKTGLAGRGKWWVGAGVVLPIVAFALWRLGIA